MRIDKGGFQISMMSHQSENNFFQIFELKIENLIMKNR